MRTLLVPLAIVILATAFSSPLGVAGEPAWPGFLGPRPSSLSDRDLPLVWSATDNIAWKATIVGYGQSSPVVWNGQVFVTSISGPMKQHCHVTAFNLASGKKLWHREFAAAFQTANNNYTSKAAPTPVVDAHGLVVWFESGNLIGLGHDGNLRWQRNLIQEYGRIDTRHGLGSSLVQTGNLAVVWVERQTDPYILAVDKLTGKTAWKVAGLQVTTWSTPCLLKVDGKQHLVFSGGGKLVGLDPDTGEKLWSFEGLAGNTIPAPQPLPGGRLLLGASAGSEEGGANTAKSNGIIQVSRSENGGFQVGYRWRAKRATSSFGSPIVHRGLAYFINKAGVLFCLDADSGKEHYVKRLGDTAWATPLAVGNRVYLVGRGGTTIVIRPGTHFEKLAENRINTKPAPAASSLTPPTSSQGPLIQYAIVAVGNNILIRTGDMLYCFREP